MKVNKWIGLLLLVGGGIFLVQNLGQKEGGQVMADEKIKILNYETGEYEMKEKIEKTEAEWKKILDKEQYHILREEGTERPFTSPLLENKGPGVYVSAASGVALFRSDQKFKSGTGWPSFFDVIDPANVELREDNSLFMKRVEVVDKLSGSHLGHVFEDGPQPTGLRYCINGDALKFVPDKDMKTDGGH